MSTLKYPRIFEPLRIGQTFFPNRIFSSPQDIYRLTYEGFLDESATAFYELKALGGHGSVCVGDLMVDGKLGRSHMFQLVGDDIKGRGSLTRTANAIRRHGAAAGIELNHAGKNAHVALESQDFIWGIIDGETHDGFPIRAMTDEVIQNAIEKYAAAAAFVVQCGFNFICIHAGHGWFPAQFMSASENTRTDKWGGSFENRMRFTDELIQTVRSRIGWQIPVEMRLSGAEAIPGGMDIDDAIAIAKHFDGKVDILHISAGHHESPSASMVSHPPIFAEDGINVHYAAEIKKHVTQSLVSTVGALTDPAHMEEIIASGKADILNLGRQTLADPFLPYKARVGLEDEINRCLRCQACFSKSVASGIFYCATNPVIGHERDSLNETPAPSLKKVLVAGGGVGGMQAALTAAERGHEVILVEKSSELGGVLLSEAAVPFKDKVTDYIRRQALRISRRPIELRLNTEVTPELVSEIAPDALIVSFGATSIKPPILGIDNSNVYEADEVFLDASLAGDEVVVLGAGLVGLELALYLAGLGKKVTVVEMQDFALSMMGELETSQMINHPELLSPDLNVVHGIALGETMKKYPDLKLFVSTKALEITAEGVKVEGPDGQRIIAADTVVYAVGEKALDNEALALRNLVPDFYMVGDCVKPGSIIDATQLAYQAARDIGRL